MMPSREILGPRRSEEDSSRSKECRARGDNLNPMTAFVNGQESTLTTLRPKKVTFLGNLWRNFSTNMAVLNGFLTMMCYQTRAACRNQLSEANKKRRRRPMGKGKEVVNTNNNQFDIHVTSKVNWLGMRGWGSGGMRYLGTNNKKPWSNKTPCEGNAIGLYN